MKLDNIELQLVQRLLQQTNFPTADLKFVAAGLQRKGEAEINQRQSGEPDEAEAPEATPA